MTNIEKLIKKAKRQRDPAVMIDTVFCNTKETVCILNEYYSGEEMNSMDLKNLDNLSICMGMIDLCLDAIFTWQFISDFTGIKYRRHKNEAENEFYENKWNSMFKINDVAYKVLDLFEMTPKELKNFRRLIATLPEIAPMNYDYKTTMGGNYNDN